MPTAVHRSSGNVFRDLGFQAGEATTLRVRSELMIRLTRVIEDRRLTRAQAARLFAVGPAEVGDLMGGKIGRFDIDSLVAMLFVVEANNETPIVPNRESFSTAGTPGFAERCGYTNSDGVVAPASASSAAA